MATTTATMEMATLKMMETLTAIQPQHQALLTGFRNQTRSRSVLALVEGL